MSSSLLQRLGQRVLLLDGGLGSMLIDAGLQAGRAPEGWVLDRPEPIVDVHRQYAEAGSDIVHACSFGGSPPKLADAGLAGRCAEVNARAVELARQGAGDRALVAGDVGPTGKLFPPMGDASEQLLHDAFGEQVEALAGAGADLIAVETMYDLREALAAVAAARAAGLPVFASMTFDAKKRGFFTLVGDRLVPALQALREAGADAVGLNCTVQPQQMIDMVQQAAEAVDAPLIAQPNAGQPQPSPDGKVLYDAEPGPFAADLVRLARAGASVVGGCCGSTPEFIRAAREALDSAGL